MTNALRRCSGCGATLTKHNEHFDGGACDECEAQLAAYYEAEQAHEDDMHRRRYEAEQELRADFLGEKP